MSVYSRLQTAAGGRLLTASYQNRKLGKGNIEYNISEGENTRIIYGFIRDGNYREAKKVVTHKLELFPRNRAAISILAWCCYLLEEYVEASTWYEQLIEVCPECKRYRLYYAQCLFKAAQYTEAITQAAKLTTDDDYTLVQQANKIIGYCHFQNEDLTASKKNRQKGLKTDPDILVLKGCILFMEGDIDRSLKQFNKAYKRDNKPSISYNISLCFFRLKKYSEAFKIMEDIIQRGAEGHPELGVGTAAEGVEIRSVGNTLTLRQTALVETFNLKCAIDFCLGNLESANLALKEMPPRKQSELDAVTLHNVGLLQMETDPTEGFKKLKHLLNNPPFPEETFPNILLLYCKYNYYFHAADILADKSQFYKYLTPELFEFLEAVIESQTSPEVGFQKLDDIATQHTERLRKITKKIQESRINKNANGIKLALKEYTESLYDYIPVLMHMARIYWDIENFPEVERILLQSEEFCAENETWKLNLAHCYFMQEKQEKFQKAITLYREIVNKHKDNLLEVPAMVLANLCVAFIMTSKNEEAETLMKNIEREETRISRIYPDKPVLHLCIVNLVIGTLYCSKEHFEFGISRVIRSLEPYNKKLMTDTWFYAKRCFLSLLESLAKHMIIIRDQVFDDIINFLDAAEMYGKNINSTISGSKDSGGADSKSMSYHHGGTSVGVIENNDAEKMDEKKRTVSYEARVLKSLFLKYNYS